MTSKDGQSIKDIAATLRGDPLQPSPNGQPTKTKRPGSQSLSNTRPPLTRSRVKASRAVKDMSLHGLGSVMGTKNQREV